MNPLKATIATLGDMQEQLPGQWVGRMNYNLAWDTFSDAFRFNRVQGASLGAGYQIRPGLAYTTLMAHGSFGFGDRRPTGSLTWRRDGPGGRLDISAFHQLREAEPVV